MINNDSRVSFCVVTDTEIIPEDFTARYKSIIAFGNACISSEEEKKRALMALVEKYSPGFEKKGRNYVNEEHAGASMLRIDIEHITGKAQI